MDWAADYSSIAKEHKQRQNRTHQREVQAARAQAEFMSSPGVWWCQVVQAEYKNPEQQSNESMPEPGREGWSEGLYGRRHPNSQAVCVFS